MNIHRSFKNIGLSKIVEISELARKIAPEYEKKSGKPFIYFQRGESSWKTPDYITEALTEAVAKGHVKYPKSGGEPFFKQAVIRYMEEMGIKNLTPKNVICTYGGQEGLQLSCSIMRGGKIAGFGPCWSCMLDNIFPYGELDFTLINLDQEDNFAIDFDELEHVLLEVDAFYLNTPHNPTGKVFSRKEIRQIVQLCDKTKTLIISDEAYKDIVYDGEHVSPLEFTDNVIAVYTFSKSFAATGFRIGWTVCRNEETIQHMMRGDYTQTAGVVTPIQYAFAAALNRIEQRDKWLSEYTKMLKERRNALHQNLRQLTYKPAGAFYCFFDLNKFVPNGQNADQFLLDLLLENGIAAVPGSAFGREYSGYLRLSFSTLNKELILDGIDRLNILFPKE